MQPAASRPGRVQNSRNLFLLAHQFEQFGLG